ncbi:urea ABC transporter permease subunit UrtC [Pandoraea terrae]|uniref:Urea ABC transporter permease subunit UrtC n=1 Tax=Pandoraea terrae TaxID=1537710 RepID=A0A5E4T6I2_9BURK|nr:urea ABC transporter permease subunit UrtC [Pandoraea terrae]VVD82583.1 urea ABC transporter permease subunit UrtC [Pandoraea terrae]
MDTHILSDLTKDRSGFTLDVPARARLLPKYFAPLLAAFVLAVLVLVPLCALVLPPSHPLHLSAYAMTLVGKIMCYAIAALALDLVWGYCGILSLGHGLFFALGGYAMGMYLMRSIGRDGVYHSDLPDFMVFLDWKSLPWYWASTEHFAYAMLLVLALPGSVAWIFGYLAFRSRVKGVYLSIITQALTFAAMLLFYRNETGFGGNNGFTDFKRILGYSITSPNTRTALFLITFVMLVTALLLCRALVVSKFGRVVTAIRDGESRAMFLGYRPLGYKLFVWTLSAMLCGIAGALYVPQVGIINPSEMAPVNSIEMAIWVAIGGRGSLLGAVVGAFLVNGAKSAFTAYFAEYWLFFLGAMFVLVPLLLPQGVMGLLAQFAQGRRAPSRDIGADAPPVKSVTGDRA